MKTLDKSLEREADIHVFLPEIRMDSIHVEIHGPRRWLYWSGATFFFSLGMLGVVLPGLPTTPFLLLMCYFLVRVSPTLHAKAISWPVVGEPLRVWHQRRGVRPGVKCVAIAMVVILVGATLLLSNLPQFVKLVIAGLAVVGIYVVLRLPTARGD